jgi:hypothetical protein
VFVDQNDQLHIVPDSGKEILLQKTRGQVSFGGPTISPDRSTVGRLAMYPDPTITYYQGVQIGFGLAIFRSVRIIHTFTTEQMFWDRQLQDAGKRVAYSTGPTHGGAAAFREVWCFGIAATISSLKAWRLEI